MMTQEIIMNVTIGGVAPCGRPKDEYSVCYVVANPSKLIALFQELEHELGQVSRCILPFIITIQKRNVPV